MKVSNSINCRHISNFTLTNVTIPVSLMVKTTHHTHTQVLLHDYTMFHW